MTAKFFDWNTTQNSLCYVAIGLTVLVGYFALMIAQKKSNLEDRTALLIGSIGVFISMISVFFTWPIAFQRSGTGMPWLLPSFCVEIGLGVFFLVSEHFCENFLEIFSLFYSCHQHHYCRKLHLPINNRCFKLLACHSKR